MNQGALPEVATEKIRKLISARVKRLCSLVYLPNAMIESRPIKQQLAQHVTCIRRRPGAGQKTKRRSYEGER
jgi:hypothetical protein